MSGTSEAESGGSGSEIVGNARYAEGDTTGSNKHSIFFDAVGLPVINGKIFVFPGSFQADTTMNPSSYIPKTYTDLDGHFAIPLVMPGTWILETNDGKGKAICTRFAVSGDGTKIDLGTLIVAKTSTLRYSIKTDLPANVEVIYYIFIMGTRLYAKGDNNQLSMELSDIPTGIAYDIKVQVVKPYPASKTFHNISFQPGVVLDMVFDLQVL